MVMAWYWKGLLFYASGWLVIGGLLAVIVQEAQDCRGKPLSKIGAKMIAFFLGGAMWPWMMWKWLQGKEGGP
jgi:hypothetical protein